MNKKMSEKIKKMHGIKMKKIYKKKPKEDTFKKYMHQRRHMKKGKTQAQIKKENKQRLELEKRYIQSKVGDFLK